MLPWTGALAGRLDELVIDSQALRGNPLGDPHERPLWVYVPPGYDDDPTARYPTVYVIQGYTGHVGMWANRQPFRQPFPETADAVFAGGAPPCIVVFVDAWTAYGGSQFVDSPGTGQLPLLPLRRGRAVRGRPLPHASPTASPGPSPASPAAATGR